LVVGIKRDKIGDNFKMKKITFSDPFIYPDKANGYKDKQGKPIKKWFVRYKIEFLYKSKYGQRFQVQYCPLKPGIFLK